MLDQSEVKKIHERIKTKVLICCDEYHSHSAISGCLVGPEDAVVICKLCETIFQLRADLKKIIEILKNDLLE